MKIALCGSMTFAKQMIEAKKILESSGHTVFVPLNAEKYADGTVAIENKWEKIEHDVIRNWYKVIESSDAVLVLNYAKNNIENYVGGNSLIEMAFAHVLLKKIFLLHPIPQMNYSDEIQSFNPVILLGELSGIK